MDTEHLVEAPLTTRNCIDEELDSFLNSTAGIDWGSDPADNMLAGLINNADTSFLNDLLSTNTTTAPIDRGGLNSNGCGLISDGCGLNNDWLTEHSPSSATSDEGVASSYNSFSPPPFINGSSPGADPTYTQRDVHIEVELGNEASTKSGSMFISEEERQMLSMEGISLPYDLSLTKSEERHVKRVRRKIKNKLSAADSRKRKKNYVDGLERRVEKCTEMNNNLMKKMKLLETENKSLLEQLRSLQTYVSQFNPSKLQTGSFMMVVILSFSLLIVPQVYKPHTIRSSLSHSRSLLDIPADEFGNIENGFIGITKDTWTPLLPLPWQYQSPALKPWNISTSKPPLT